MSSARIGDCVSLSLALDLLEGKGHSRVDVGCVFTLVIRTDLIRLRCSFI